MRDCCIHLSTARVYVFELIKSVHSDGISITLPFFFILRSLSPFLSAPPPLFLCSSLFSSVSKCCSSQLLQCRLTGHLSSFCERSFTAHSLLTAHKSILCIPATQRSVRFLINIYPTTSQDEWNAIHFRPGCSWSS